MCYGPINAGAERSMVWSEKKTAQAEWLGGRRTLNM